MDGQHTWSYALNTANVLPAGGLPSGTPRTFDWEGAFGKVHLGRCIGPKPTEHGFSARAHTGRIPDRAPPADGPAFIPMPEGKGPQPEVWVDGLPRCRHAA